MVRASSTSKQQEKQAAPDDEAQNHPPERTVGWRAISGLRWRPGTGQHFIFLSDWSRTVAQDARPSAQEEDSSVEEQGDGQEAWLDQQEHVEEERPEEAAAAEELLPPVEMLRTVADRWVRVTNGDEDEYPALISFRAPGVVSPAELTRWLPGAAARLYTLGGLVAPLSDTALSKPPLSNYSVVRAPNMSFWPHLRALIEEQEREEPGMDLWEDLDSDLAQLERELAWWNASAQGLILNLYEGETLVGHLSLARQYDEAEGCDGWGIIALHIARRARGQRLGMLLQRVAATLIVTRKAAQYAAPPAEEETTGDPSQTQQMTALDTRHWPFVFGFVPAHNIPALRGAYRAGRRIIGTYVDVPLEALYASQSDDQPADAAGG